MAADPAPLIRARLSKAERRLICSSCGHDWWEHDKKRDGSVRCWHVFGREVETVHECGCDKFVLRVAEEVKGEGPRS